MCVSPLIKLTLADSGMRLSGCELGAALKVIVGLDKELGGGLGGGMETGEGLGEGSGIGLSTGLEEEPVLLAGDGLGTWLGRVAVLTCRPHCQC